MSTSHFPFDYTQSEHLPVLVASALGTILTGFAIHFALKTTRIQPGEPPLFPGALPLLGHVIQYGKDANKIFHEATYVFLTLPTISTKISDGRHI
jgi:hypothetical protein